MPLTSVELWRKLWSVARHDLSLSDEEFGELTPRNFQALLKRKEEEITHTELLFGILTSVVANFSMASPKTPTKPSDYMPSQWKERTEKPKKKKINRKQIDKGIRCFLEARKNIVY